MKKKNFHLKKVFSLLITNTPINHKFIFQITVKTIKTAYLKDSWNILDFSIVVVSLLTWILNAVV